MSDFRDISVTKPSDPSSSTRRDDAASSFSRRSPAAHTGLKRAVRRSLHVAALKGFLPVLACAIIALILAWPHLMPEDNRFRLQSVKVGAQDIEALRMTNARYVGVDEEQRPYVITAVTAIQSAGDSDQVELAEPKADMTMQSGAWAALTAKSGLYRRAANRLDLTGDVSVFHDSGAELHTETATINLATHDVTSTDPTRARGPAGTIQGEGLKILDHGNRIIFVGKSHAVLRHTPGKAS